MISRIMAFSAILVSIQGFVSTVSGQTAFTDQTIAAGLTAVQVESDGHRWISGGTVGDFNGDGYQDIFYCSNDSFGNQLFINMTNGTFEDQTTSFGLCADGHGNSASAADVNNDGFLDLYISGYRDSDTSVSDALFLNSGGVFFVNATDSAGLEIVHRDELYQLSSWGACWGDYDRDGDLDLLTSKWIGPIAGAGLYRNDGSGRFENVSDIARLNDEPTSGPNGTGPIWAAPSFTARIADMDGDRYPELIFIGDFQDSRYFRSRCNGTFTNIVNEAGLNKHFNEMGMTVADLDMDGLFDIFTTYIGPGAFYKNLGGHFFDEVPSAEVGHPNVFGWGAVSVDFDNDARIDLITTSYQGQTAMLNQSSPGNLSFLDVTALAGISQNDHGRGLANLDYDNDGDQDILVFERWGPMRLYRNELSANGNNWIRISLDTTSSSTIPPAGIGSVVKVRIGDQWQVGRIDGGSNYLSQSELTAHFGLGTAPEIDEVRVEWSDGAVTSILSVAANQHLTIPSCSPSCRPLPVIGDANCDGRINALDIEGYILAFLDNNSYEVTFPSCSTMAVDFDGDGVITNTDIASLVSDVLLAEE